jgi:hypothetical protein
MRRLALTAAALALVVAACGDDGAATTTSSGTPSISNSGTETTTSASSTTTADPVAVRLELARIFAGEFVGQWANSTYGSTGTAFIAVAVDPEAKAATITIDPGGEVFGGGDPASFEIVLDLSAAPPYVVATPLFGELAVAVQESGAFALEAADVPAAGIASFSANGAATSVSIDLEYTVTFDDGSSARGTVALRRPTS